MPEHESNEVPEKRVFFGILSIVNTEKTWDIIEETNKARNTHYKKEKDEVVELTRKIKKSIDSILLYKSKPFSLIFSVSISGKVLYFWK